MSGFNENKFVYLLFLLALFVLLAPFCNVNAQDNNQKPQLLLLEQYQETTHNIKNWLMSEKLDGVRAYWDGKKLLSRGGKVFAAPDWFTQGFPPFEIDGELWSKRGDFENIVSIVNRQKPHEGWKQIRYHIFEVPNTEGGLMQRLGKLERYLHQSPAPFIKIIPQTVCSGNEHLKRFHGEIEKAGGEGVVVRAPDTPYQTGRKATSLKVKNYQDADCRVTGYKPGKGKFQGLTGALFCEQTDGLVITIGSGLKLQQRTTPPPIGSIITYKHFGFTAKGKPRFPVFMRIRKLPIKPDSQ